MNVSKVFKHIAFGAGQGGYNTHYHFEWDDEQQEESNKENKET